MPGPVIRDLIPDALKAENASVFDSPITKAIRILARLTGADDPTGQLLSAANPMGIAVMRREALLRLLQDALPAEAALPQARHIINNDPSDMLSLMQQRSDIGRTIQNFLRANLGDEFTVYRGGPIEGRQAVSTSLNRDVAKWFARRHGTPMQRLRVTPDDVLFPGSSLDQELVINPTRIRRRGPLRPERE